MRGTSRVCLEFGDNQTMLDGYTDVDMFGDIDSKKIHIMVFNDICMGNYLLAIEA